MTSLRWTADGLKAGCYPDTALWEAPCSPSFRIVPHSENGRDGGWARPCDSCREIP
jgi:hypothetical protein